jgi:hypothetical protein
MGSAYLKTQLQPASGFSTVNESRLKGGCSQDWPPYKRRVPKLAKFGNKVESLD